MTIQTDDLANLKGSQQVEMLKSLNQQAAAFLLGVTARTLRDHPEVPRNADGSYDARELQKSGLMTTALSDPSPDELEKLWQIGESLAWDDLIPAALQLATSLQERYGTVTGLAMFAQSLLESWTESHKYQKPEPTESEIRSKAEERFQEDLQRNLNGRLKRQLRVVTFCETCKQVRRGRQWLNGHVPSDSLSRESMCPTCDEKQAKFDKLPARRRLEILALRKAGLTEADLVE